MNAKKILALLLGAMMLLYPLQPAAQRTTTRRRI